MRSLLQVVVIAGMFAAGFSGIEHARANEEAVTPPLKKRTVAESNTDFALDLYKLQAAEGKNGNLFFSPFSLSSALGMTLAGARNATEQEMLGALRFDLPQESLHTSLGALTSDLRSRNGEGLKLRIANALWGQENVNYLPEFLGICGKRYNAELRLVDFAGDAEGARTKINDWVSGETENLIKDLLSPGAVNGTTALVLTNAIYFKGDWAHQFDKEETEDAIFYGAAGEKTVPMMHQHRKEGFQYATTDTYRILSMPYKGDTVSMLILLPDRKVSLADVEAGLTAASLNRALKGLEGDDMEVWLPRFKLEYGFSVVKALGALGMPSAFGAGADFSGMTGRPDFFINDVIHKAFVSVNEEGTEAAAATAVVMAWKSVPEVIPFRVDRPFLFMIRDNATGSILFIGRMMDPVTE